MKRKQLIVFITLLLAAVLLGALLPIAVFSMNDRMLEGKTTAIQIRQYDLSYQSDLDTASRLRLTQRDISVGATVSLERGIYLQEQEVADICQQFIRAMTGFSFSVSSRYDMTPALLTFPGKGAIIVWIVSLYLNESWSCEFVIDDQTGLILRCSFHGAPWQWDSLVKDCGSVPAMEAYISLRMADALCMHFSTRLDTELTVDVQRDAISDHNVFSAKVSLYKEGQVEFVIPLTLVSAEGYLSIN